MREKRKKKVGWISLEISAVKELEGKTEEQKIEIDTLLLYFPYRWLNTMLCVLALCIFLDPSAHICVSFFNPQKMYNGACLFLKHRGKGRCLGVYMEITPGI